MFSRHSVKCRCSESTLQSHARKHPMHTRR
jgi:hypothetical protein